MKILSFNVGYFLGFQSQREWIRRPHRLLVGDRTGGRERIERFVEVVMQERPDVVAVQEVDQGSIRSHFENQCQTIANYLERTELSYRSRADVKYGVDNPISNLPVLRNMSNAIFWKAGHGRAQYLSKGTKRLVQVVEAEGVPTVMSVHLSKTESAREEQMRELAGVTDNHDEVILTGDFNVKHRTEFEPLVEQAGFELHVPGKSFSTANPNHTYDVFLTTEGVTVGRCEVLDGIRLSDHMPIVAETRHD
ncbi:endonuclease/exonuclease/phosphatase family protein [Halobellus ruber]|uniref:Endonuclease/exonuclease/phosphatase family protein n=1 Tax=Halobellus ruber TaxID=2761102 RepID=A0A7J9SKY6_9EURY|nr:endonuclease/exonuclease/phosphatase family protein [Halobellus ruber]MBB6647358.1 endonuclease/exonuclease/phosphatase family protein [Halobellus ruber]